MDKIQIRLECLRLSNERLQGSQTAQLVIDRAKEYETYVVAEEERSDNLVVPKETKPATGKKKK